MSRVFLRQDLDDSSAVHDESDHDEDCEDDVNAKGDHVVRRSVRLGQLAVER
jgi:hypothetical protein